LVPVLQRFGDLYELRLMLDFNGANRGYCFATYATRADAKRAARELNDLEIRSRRYIGACLSVDNCRLFVGGIPRNKQKQVRTRRATVTQFRVPVHKPSGGVLGVVCLSGARCRLAYGPADATTMHSLSLASVKSRFVLPFWYRLTCVVPVKGPLNGCVCVYFQLVFATIS